MVKKMKVKISFRRILAAVLAVVMVLGALPVSAATPLGSSDQGDGTYTNPAIWADVPDMSIIRVGDAYYMSSTVMHLNPGVPIMKSYDLVNWEIISYCYLVMGDSDNMKLQTGNNMYTNGTWASALAYKDGVFYCAVPSPTTNKTYLFQTEDPETKPWRRYELGARYHDCGLLLDDDGRNWLVYGTNAIELNSTVTGLAPGASARSIGLSSLHAPDPVTGQTPTSGLNEGIQIRKINGKYYLFAITWPSGKPRTEVCHISDSLFGPWESRVVAQENVNGGGPAQGGIVDDGKGNWYGFVFRDSGAVGRIPWILPITWDGQWPMFGKDAQGNPSYTGLQRSGLKPVAGYELSSCVTSDEFYNNADKPLYYDSNITPLDPSLTGQAAIDAMVPVTDPQYAYNGSNLKLEWQWNHNPDNRYWSLTEREGWLRLTTGHKVSDVLSAPNTISQRTFGPTSSAVIKLDVSGMKNGDAAGLSLFTAKYGAISVRMANGTKTLVMTNSSSTTSHSDVASAELTSEIVYLKADADFTNQTDKGTFYYSYDGITWTQLGNQQQMSYSTDNHFMGYRFSIFNYATQTTGGYVDVDFYRLSDKLYGAAEPTVLNVKMDGQVKLSGKETIEIPVYLDKLPGGKFTEIAASFHIPESLTVTDVAFADTVKGELEWEQNGKQLEIAAYGSDFAFTPAEPTKALFATLELSVADDAPASAYVGLDYVIARGDTNVAYEFSDHDHEYEETVVPVTCTTNGYTTGVCTICGNKITYDIKEALGHAWGAGVVTIEPTKETTGLMTYSCVRCDATKTKRLPREGQTVPMDIDFTDPDSASEFEVKNQEVTSIRDGEGLYLVTTTDAFEDCNGQLSGSTPKDVAVIPVEGDQWAATLKFDFDMSGAGNGYYQFFGFYAAEGDDYQNMAGIRGGDGAFQNFLRVDGAITADSEGMNSSPGLDTNTTYWWKLVKDIDTYTCYRSADGETFTEMFSYADTGIEADYIVLDAYTGMTEGYAFTVKSLTFDAIEGTDEPCEHDYKAVVTEPTCTEIGFTTYTCAKCGDKYAADETEALGHKWDDGVVTKLPTPEEDGVMTFTCTVCGATMTKKIPITGPDCPSDIFSDVPDEDHWAHPGIDYCVENELMNGTGGDKFSPEGTLTRAQLVTILYRVENEPAVELKGTFS
ncbi:MAG: hypothetical protein E7464_08445, partial [Ruminococcaceae bacterium]|nr:hypothetical protein [Oscillospiraceae bacterium]